MTNSTGIDFTYRNGEEANLYALVEFVGGGVALFDYDRDGLLDVFLAGGGYVSDGVVRGYPCGLYHNEGDWQFRDVTKSVGLSGSLVFTHGCYVADYDDDGWPDLLVTGYGQLTLYRNKGGSGFEDVTQRCRLAIQKPDLHWSTAASWADLNNDGHLDLFVAHLVDWSPAKNPPRETGPATPSRDIDSPDHFDPLTQQLFLSRGDGTFEEVGREKGLLPGKALGALVFDLDGDGLLDLYVANDTLQNQFYVNRGNSGFKETGALAGVALGWIGEVEGSMGVDVVDLDSDGLFSLFVTNYQDQLHAFYHNEGQGLFFHATHRMGIAAIGGNYVGWGTAFFDVDLDGDEDLLISNGHSLRYPPAPQSLRQQALLLENRGAESSRQFVDISGNSGDYFLEKHRGRGFALGDLDNDGRLDVVISHINEPVAILRNIHPGAHNWLGIELERRAPRDPIGTRLILDTSEGQQVRTVKTGGYLSTHDRRVVFGLGHSQLQKLTVIWPSGLEQSWNQSTFKRNAYYRIKEATSLPIRVLNVDR